MTINFTKHGVLRHAMVYFHDRYLNAHLTISSESAVNELTGYCAYLKFTGCLLRRRNLSMRRSQVIGRYLYRGTKPYSELFAFALSFESLAFILRSFSLLMTFKILEL